MQSVLEESMEVNGSVNSSNCVCPASAGPWAPAGETHECPIRDANGAVSMAVGGSL